MNFKRKITGIFALSLVGALSITAVSAFDNTNDTVNAATKFGDINSDGYIDAVDASIILSYYAYLQTTEGTPMTLEKYMARNADKTEPTTSDLSNKDISLKTGGDTFTIVSWNRDEVPSLISNWTGIEVEDVIERLYSESNEKITAPSGANINFINLGTAGGYAPERYDEMFNQGEDIDVYLVEPYWALRYMDNDAHSAPLSSLGISENDMNEWYPYTKKLAQNSKGVYKSVPYCIAPGAFAYRSDLAEKYLGVTTPEEMQTAIGDWSKFSSSAKTIAEKTEGKVALADSIAGMWQAYSCGRFDFITSENKLNLSTDVRSFADMAKDLWKSGGVTKNSQWNDEWIQAGQYDQCMGYFVPSWAFFYGESFLYESTNKQPGKWSMCIGPQAYYWGGNDMLVNPSTDNGDDARSFIISSAFNSDNMKRYACNNMPNNMSVNAQLAKDKTYYDTDMLDILNGQNYYSVLDQSARSIDIKKYSIYDDTISSYIISQIKDSYIDKGKNWDETLTAIQDKIKNDYDLK